VSAARKSAAQASSAKQKKIAIGGAVLLVGILVIQGPKMLKLVSGSSAPPAPAAVAPPVTAGAVPGAVTPTPAPAPVSAVPETTGTKLVSFETFGTKDPFAPQVDVNSEAAIAATNADEVGDAVASAPASAPQTASNSTSAPAATPATSGTSTPSTGSTATKPTFKVAGSTSTATATIAVNSKRQVVTVDHDFPTGDPVFTLVGVGSGSASIAIAGGSLKAGGKTFALTVGTPTTLLNTATGKKYKLDLLSTAPAGG
jgi:hypothetical protein